MTYTTSLLVAAAAAAVPAMAQTPPGFSPSTDETFEVIFRGEAITAGDPIPIPVAAVSPAIDFSDVAGDSAHVLAMMDLDPPAEIAPLLHWMSAIPAGVSTLASNGSSTVESPVPFFGPAPPPSSGPHRYVLFLLNDPADEFAVPEGFDLSTQEGWMQFDLEGFMEAGGFTLAAANYFTAENTTSTGNGTNSTQPTSSTTPPPSETAPPPESAALGSVAELRSAVALGGAFVALSYFFL